VLKPQTQFNVHSEINNPRQNRKRGRQKTLKGKGREGREGMREQAPLSTQEQKKKKREKREKYKLVPN